MWVLSLPFLAKKKKLNKNMKELAASNESFFRL